MIASVLLPRIAAAIFTALALSFAAAPAALAKKAIVGPVSLEVPDDFKDVAGATPAIHQDSSGITARRSSTISRASASQTRRTPTA
jgi:hypothetical protein